LTRSPRSSPERRRLAALAFAGLGIAGLTLLASAVAAQPAARQDAAGGVEARARATLADPRYQRALPNRPEPEDERDLPTGRSVPQPVPLRVPLPVLGAGAALSKLIFLVMLVVVIALVALWIVQAIPRRGAAEPLALVPGKEKDEAAGVAGAELSFADAARLAAEGRYAEAVHALLLAAIRHFAARTRTAIQPSRTSRELVRTLPLAPDAREAFADLVRTVERSLFGGEPLGAEEYERNLERFQALTRRAA
jgi:hypothetical protein